MTTLVSVVIPVKWCRVSSEYLWETQFFWKACGTGRLWGRTAGNCESTQLGKPEAWVSCQTHPVQSCSRVTALDVPSCELGSVLQRLLCFNSCICICKLGLGWAKCLSKYGWTPESEPDHSHIPTFVKCKKQWEVACALQCHKNTMLDLAPSPLYREWSESLGWKEKSLTHCETWITAHIPCLG